jgi:hypothetical protein
VLPQVTAGHRASGKEQGRKSMLGIVLPEMI